jgi:hypothetical protein
MRGGRRDSAAEPKEHTQVLPYRAAAVERGCIGSRTSPARMRDAFSGAGREAVFAPS